MAARFNSSDSISLLSHLSKCLDELRAEIQRDYVVAEGIVSKIEEILIIQTDRIMKEPNNSLSANVLSCLKALISLGKNIQNVKVALKMNEPTILVEIVGNAKVNIWATLDKMVQEELTIAERLHGMPMAMAVSPWTNRPEPPSPILDLIRTLASEGTPARLEMMKNMI